MRMISLNIGFLAVVLACSGCIASPSEAEQKPQKSEVLMTIHGKLIRKGNEPATYPVLVRQDSTQWELTGVSDATILQLQNSDVDVEGYITPEPKSASLLPILRVTKIGKSGR